jgi:hypothetical protein
MFGSFASHLETPMMHQCIKKQKDQRRRKRRGGKPGLRSGKKNSCSLQCIATCREHKLFFINGVIVRLGMIKA